MGNTALELRNEAWVNKSIRVRRPHPMSAYNKHWVHHYREAFGWWPVSIAEPRRA